MRFASLQARMANIRPCDPPVEHSGRALPHEARETVVAVLVSRTESDFIARLAQTPLHISHGLACHFIAPKAANVTIDAQWRVSQPAKHAPLAGRLSIRQKQSPWRESPVQRVARKYAWRERSIIFSWSKRLVLAGWVPFIKHAICNWIGSWR